MVYLIVDEENKFCKIGFSQCPEKRLQQLQQETILKLRLVFSIVGGIRTEKYIHSKFSLNNASREWFKYSQDIYDYFERCYNDAENINYRANKIPVRTFEEIKQGVYICLVDTSIDGYVFIFNLKDEIIKSLDIKANMFTKAINELRRDSKLRYIKGKEYKEAHKRFPNLIVTTKLKEVPVLFTFVQ